MDHPAQKADSDMEDAPIDDLDGNVGGGDHALDISDLVLHIHSWGLDKPDFDDAVWAPKDAAKAFFAAHKVELHNTFNKYSRIMGERN